ncbi:hypothetical protein Deba_3031 [Desulfarculus baarsii DSM 2075]|uniref:Uncharacterized protein n=1 Tax=Desulfarculus baarsii (strain ATCC 33931 / DSM 2075 / LMG 7858 / VKM B-1802 / 2st14) TaxID=644282 RepID=E1QLE9_DESB2|nr:hypothetical protein [Desulfarculus baarsii]ADK86384.1 hypothetical protein Deba_3031 [Desulfarculus baarsii DSM 2075]
MSDNNLEPRLVLPPASKIILPLGAVGEWERMTGESSMFLHTLAEALDVTNIDQNVARIFSIPDVWAQVELFKTAFGDGNHVLHERFVAAWRGMLALLALTSLRDLPVYSKVLRVSTLAARPFHGDAASATNKVNLAEVLHGMRPAECLLRDRQDQAWDQLALLYVDRAVVDLLSPTTLVCPARGKLRLNVGGLPWIVDGRFTDPILCKHLTLDDYSAIHHYVDHIQESINNIPDGLNHDLHGHLNKQLQEYLDALRTAIGPREMTKMALGESSAIETPDFSIYALLNRLPSCLDNGGMVSDVALPEQYWTLSGAVADRRQVVVRIDDLPKQWGLPETDVTIWRRVSYSHYDSLNQAQKDKLRAEMRAANTIMLGVDDIFTDRLHKLDNASIDAHPQGMEGYILPLKPKMLYFMTPDQIKVALAMEDYGEAITVSLRLELISSRAGEKRQAIIKKRYPRESVKVGAPPMLGVYPRFTHPGFGQYFFPYSGNTKISPLVDLPFSTCFAEKNLRSGDNDLLDVVQNDKFAFDAGLAVNVVREKSTVTGLLSGVMRMDHQPSAIICRSEEPTEIKTTETRLAGVILLPAMEAAHSSDEDWRIAIDLGSTNTSAYCRRGRNDPEPMVFSPQILIPLGRERDTWRDELSLRFLPPEQTALPVLSCLEDFHDLANGYDGPLIDGRIYYQLDIRRALKGYLEDQEKGRRRINFDLKWRAEVDDIRRLIVYVGQLALQSLVDVVQKGADPRRVNWVFSYPLSMGRHMIDLEGCFCKAVAALLGEDNVGEAKARSAFVTESLAAAGYFRHKMKTSFAGSAITVDMGGVTSDICLWRDNQLIWQSSLKFGGRDLLIGYLNHRRDLLAHMAGKGPNKSSLDAALTELGANKENKAHLTYAIEMVVNSPDFGQMLDANMAMYRSSPPFAGLVLVAKVALAGLCAYMGMVTQHFRLDAPLVDDQTPMKFCLGGRGSKLFKSVIESDKEFLDGLKAIYEKYSLGGGALEFVFSQDPKQEVAYGALLSSDDLPLHMGEFSTAVISGEDIDVGGRRISHYEELKTSDVVAGLDALELTQFAAFLRLFSQVFAIPAPWDEKVRLKLVESVREQYNAEKNQLIDSAMPTTSGAGRVIHVSAPFITTLRTYIDIWMKSNGAV